jgi:hypothetical protein
LLSLLPTLAWRLLLAVLIIGQQGTIWPYSAWLLDVVMHTTLLVWAGPAKAYAAAVALET